MPFESVIAWFYIAMDAAKMRILPNRYRDCRAFGNPGTALLIPPIA
jgi:hypothetical protein